MAILILLGGGSQALRQHASKHAGCPLVELRDGVGRVGEWKTKKGEVNSAKGVKR